MLWIQMRMLPSLQTTSESSPLHRRGLLILLILLILLLLLLSH